MERDETTSDVVGSAPVIPGFSNLTLISAVSGQATVYKAIQDGLNRDVAIKVFDRSRSSSVLRRFERECEVLATLSQRSPHVVDIYLAGTTSDGWPYLVMPWLTGGTLQAKVERAVKATGSGLPFDEVRKYGLQIGAALAVAHGSDPPVLHRDIKPGNIMLDGDGNAVLIDFGIAAVRDGNTTLSLAGTRDWMAPEIELARDGQWPSSPASDLYSFGATLYYLLSGANPTFNRDSSGNIRPLDPSQCPPELNTAILTTLNTKPTKRGTLPDLLRSTDLAALGRKPASRRTGGPPRPGSAVSGGQPGSSAQEDLRRLLRFLVVLQDRRAGKPRPSGTERLVVSSMIRDFKSAGSWQRFRDLDILDGNRPGFREALPNVNLDAASWQFGMRLITPPACPDLLAAYSRIAGLKAFSYDLDRSANSLRLWPLVIAETTAVVCRRTNLISGALLMLLFLIGCWLLPLLPFPGPDDYLLAAILVVVSLWGLSTGLKREWEALRPSAVRQRLEREIKH